MCTILTCTNQGSVSGVSEHHVVLECQAQSEIRPSVELRSVTVSFYIVDGLPPYLTARGLAQGRVTTCRQRHG